jgi:polysaccharide biosynthesis/export protein
MTSNWFNFLPGSVETHAGKSDQQRAWRSFTEGAPEMNFCNLCSRLLMFGLIALSAAIPASAQVNLSGSPAGTGRIDNGNIAPETTYIESGTPLHKRNTRYTIHPSDTLELRFSLTPEFNQIVTVQPDGYISLHDVGDLPASGKTLSELTALIKNAYSTILHDPVISVDLKDFEKPYITVGGQVGKPGKFDLRGDITVTQAIALAGGFTDASKHSQVLLFRRVSDQWTEARIINVKKMLGSRDLREDPELRAGDMLFIPKNALSKIKPFLPTTSAGVFASPPIF